MRGADDVIAYHVRQSFRPGEITPEEANRLGIEFARRFTKGNHAFVVCTHIDKSHIHNHIIWSSVSLGPVFSDVYKRQIIDYVANPQKTDNGKLITGYACDSRTVDAEFLVYGNPSVLL